MTVAIIFIGGSPRQNECFWPSYNNAESGIDHDLIVVHRDMANVPFIENKRGSIVLENKIYPHGELPHKAFGAYREYWNRNKNNYDFFAFISDDVIIKSNDWLSDAVAMLETHDKLGFVGTQIFNGDLKQYPHISHCRAPIWFGKSSAIKKIDWKFNSDHEGEMNLGEQFLAAGYFGAQVGNKIDIAYDAIDNQGFGDGDHVSSLMEKKLGHGLRDRFDKDERQKMRAELLSRLFASNDVMTIKSSHKHIGERKVISQLQPFNGLVFDKSHKIAAPYIEKCPFGINILKGYLGG